MEVGRGEYVKQDVLTVEHQLGLVDQVQVPQGLVGAGLEDIILQDVADQVRWWTAGVAVDLLILLVIEGDHRYDVGCSYLFQRSELEQVVHGGVHLGVLLNEALQGPGNQRQSQGQSRLLGGARLHSCGG